MLLWKMDNDETKKTEETTETEKIIVDGVEKYIAENFPVFILQSYQ